MPLMSPQPLATTILPSLSMVLTIPWTSQSEMSVLCQYHSVLIPVSLWQALKSGSMSPQICSSLSGFLAILGPLRFFYFCKKCH